MQWDSHHIFHPGMKRMWALTTANNGSSTELIMVTIANTHPSIYLGVVESLKQVFICDLKGIELCFFISVNVPMP